ncbi:MAG: sigma-70 family RNA polymerase sigma factor [Treponema sp.]|nr:sigma-70 family RNA polymerase sigma factor [Treponema sp.]
MGKTIADWHKEYFPLVFRRCMHMLRNTHDAEDAAQEVFIRLIKAEGRGMDLGEIKNNEALLWACSSNVCLNCIRKKKKQGENFPLFEEKTPAEGNVFDRIDAKLFLQAVLEHESEETRLYCYMYYFDRMKLTEIAETVGKSKSWVHKKIETFKRETRRKLEEAMK